MAGGGGGGGGGGGRTGRDTDTEDREIKTELEFVNKMSDPGIFILGLSI
jgi:hypothetical protein